jgi:hypothetical protein
MDRSIETFPLERFRELMGVPPETYERGDNFQRKVIEPAVLEVNGLSDMGVQIDLGRLHSRAPIHSVTVEWWRKAGDEFRASIQERSRSKVGRMARLRGEVEKIEAMEALPSSSKQQKVQATVDAMRKADAPESDIEAFMKSQAT